MLKPRIIPTLLLRDNHLVKGKKFTNFRYLGDPINAVRLFNDKMVDELVFLDIASKAQGIDPTFVQKLADECFMPFSVGGGITKLSQIRELLKSGAEKVILNTSAFENPKLVKEATQMFGSQSIIISIDVKKSFFGSYRVYTKSGRQKTNLDPIEYSKLMEDMGAGEILLNCIGREGQGEGYDLDLLSKVSKSVKIPLIAAGGPGSINHLISAIRDGGASSVSVGSMFVFHGRRDAVLINYLNSEERIFFLESVLE